MVSKKNPIMERKAPNVLVAKTPTESMDGKIVVVARAIKIFRNPRLAATASALRLGMTSIQYAFNGAVTRSMPKPLMKKQQRTMARPSGPSMN